MDWSEVTAIATVAATVITLGAFIATAIYVISTVRAFERDQFVDISSGLYSIFQSREFMDDQLWLMRSMGAKTWSELISAHRSDTGEAAFHRVGSFYDRVGLLVRMGLVKPGDILPTIGPYAIAVWKKIEPLVREARRIENSTLFVDFEKVLPECYECYVPALGPGADVAPFSPIQPTRQSPQEPAQKWPQKMPDPVADRGLRVDLEEAQYLTEKGQALLLDVRRAASHATDSRSLPHSVVIPPDEIEKHYTQLPRDQEIIAYCA
jgi:hypothetical protein